MHTGIQLKWLGRTDYSATLAAMQAHTAARQADAPDEFWIVEHDPVYTLGMNADPQNILHAGDIPVVRTDRGGQVTYHGPGQIVIYTLLDLNRRKGGVRGLVSVLESAVIDLLRSYGLQGGRLANAPGVYIDGAKIAALGLRVRRGYCYHGLALNVDIDLSAFSGINPCGYSGLAVTRLQDLGVNATAVDVAPALCLALLQRLA